ncbi:MAG: hypothetical protein AAB508_02540, partial [Patescibacteria group bacterium]
MEFIGTQEKYGEGIRKMLSLRHQVFEFVDENGEILRVAPVEKLIVFPVTAGKYLMADTVGAELLVQIGESEVPEGLPLYTYADVNGEKINMTVATYGIEDKTYSLTEFVKRVRSGDISRNSRVTIRHVEILVQETPFIMSAGELYEEIMSEIRWQQEQKAQKEFLTSHPQVSPVEKRNSMEKGAHLLLKSGREKLGCGGETGFFPGRPWMDADGLTSIRFFGGTFFKESDINEKKRNNQEQIRYASLVDKRLDIHNYSSDIRRDTTERLAGVSSDSIYSNTTTSRDFVSNSFSLVPRVYAATPDGGQTDGSGSFAGAVRGAACAVLNIKGLSKMPVRVVTEKMIAFSNSLAKDGGRSLFYTTKDFTSEHEKFITQKNAAKKVLSDLETKRDEAQSKEASEAIQIDVDAAKIVYQEALAAYDAFMMPVYVDKLLPLTTMDPDRRDRALTYFSEKIARTIRGKVAEGEYSRVPSAAFLSQGYRFFKDLAVHQPEIAILMDEIAKKTIYSLYSVKNPDQDVYFGRLLAEVETELKSGRDIAEALSNVRKRHTDKNKELYFHSTVVKPFLLDDVKSPSQLVFDSESDCFQLAAVFTSLIDVLKAKGLIDPSVKADIVIGFSGYPHAYTRIINKEKDEIVAYDGYIMPTKDFINWVQNDMKNSPTYDSEFGYILDPGDVRDTKQTRANNPRVPKLYSFNSSVSRKDHINYGLYLYMKKHYQDWTGKQMAPFQNMYQADPSMSLTALGQKVFEYWQSESPRNTYTIGDANAYAAIVLEDAGNTIPEIEEKKKWIEDAGAALKAATAGTPESQPLIIELGKKLHDKIERGFFTLDEIDSLLNLAYAFPVGN